MGDNEYAKELDLIKERLGKSEMRLASLRRRMETGQKWNKSVWRIGIPPLIAYIATGAFYEVFIHVPDPWLRAFAPVIAIVTYTAVMPFVRRRWVRKHQRPEEDPDPFSPF